MFKDLYSLHPSFKHSFPQLTYDDLIAKNLDIVHRHAFLSSMSFNRSSILELKRKSISLLENLFQAWNLVAEPGLHQEFLADLHAEALYLLDADFNLLYCRSIRTMNNIINTNDLDSLAALKADGFLHGVIPLETIASIRNVCQPLIDKLLRNESLATSTDRNLLSCDSGRIIRIARDKLNSVFEKSGLNNLMSFYVGYDVCLSGLALEIGSEKSIWWKSIYSEVDSPLTSYMHRDEDIARPKAFIYLSPIMRENGAFSVVPNANDFHGEPSWLQSLLGRRIGQVGRSRKHFTHGKLKHLYHHAFGDPTFRSLFLSLPPECRYSSHYGWDTSMDNELIGSLLTNEFFLEGPPGSYILFDGARLTHKALVGATNEHISLQAIFSKKSGFPEKAFRKTIAGVSRLIK